MTFQTMTLGYARMGKRREVKKALEAYWSGTLDAETMLSTVRDIEVHSWKTRLAAGIDHIGVLSWAVDAFRLATAVAQPQTQIHTHMCYCEFGDSIQDIERLDADVISIQMLREEIYATAN